MNKYYRLLYFLTLALFVCCSESTKDVLLHHLDYIKQNGNSEPLKALEELQTLEADIHNCHSDYIHYKHLLLKARLQDKAFLIPNSPDTIERVVNYFEKNGNNEERMESYYYQASMYRDLKDYPRALTSLNKVLEISEKHETEDSILLQNTYSQLSWLYNKQQLYVEALKMAEIGCSMAEKTGTLDPIYLMDVATASCHTGDTLIAIGACRRTLDFIKNDSLCSFPDVVCELLLHFSDWSMEEEAEDCLSLLQESKNSRNAHNYLAAMVRYFKCHSSMDSAAVYNERILAESSNLSQKLAASHDLMDFHAKRATFDKSALYANLYSHYVDSVFAENQYEQTSRACGEHLYAVSLEKEMEARKDAYTYRTRTYAVIVMFLLSALVASILISQRKKRYLGMLLSKENALLAAKDAIKRNDERLAESELVMDGQRQKLAILESELSTIAKEMGEKMAEKELLIQQQNEKMMSLNRTIAENESALLEKQKQIKELVKLTLLEKASIDSSDILQKFHDSSYGKDEIENADWQSLYLAIETLYPGFRESVMSMPRNSELNVKTAYLLKIGFSNSQIANLTECSRTTVWDRVKKIRGCLGDLLDKNV